MQFLASKLVIVFSYVYTQLKKIYGNQDVGKINKDSTMILVHD